MTLIEYINRLLEGDSLSDQARERARGDGGDSGPGDYLPDDPEEEPEDEEPEEEPDSDDTSAGVPGIGVD